MIKTANFLPALFIALLPGAAQAQVIEKIETQLETSGSREVSNDFDSGLFWLDLFFNVGFYPTFGLLFGFEGEPLPNEAMFSRFPYDDGRNGIYQPIENDGYRKRTQVVAHFQNNEDALYGGFGQVKFSPNRFLTLDVNRLQLFEQLEDGGNDHFSITTFNLEYNRVRGSQFHLWWGAGLMLLDGKNLYGSPSMTVGFNWFFKKPLSLYADTQFGFPNGTYARQHQVRMQVHLNRYMLYAGYHGLRVGSERVPNLTIGTGMWF